MHSFCQFYLSSQQSGRIGGLAALMPWYMLIPRIPRVLPSSVCIVSCSVLLLAEGQAFLEWSCPIVHAAHY